MECSIAIKDLIFSYEKEKILNGITLSIPKGSIFGLVGKNGAGKTTLLQILLGLMTPDNGEIRIAGSKDNTTDCIVGFVPERPYYHLNFRLKEYLYLLSNMGSSHVLDRDIEEAISLVSLQGYEESLLKRFSKGMLHRVGLALVFLQKPDVLLLDEPMSGLDPYGQRDVREIVYTINQREGVTILFTSHNLYEVERLSHTIGILHRGKVTLINRESISGPSYLEMALSLSPIEIAKLFGSYEEVQIEKNRVILPAGDKELYFAIMERLVEDRIQIVEMKNVISSLEEITLRILSEKE